MIVDEPVIAVQWDVSKPTAHVLWADILHRMLELKLLLSVEKRQQLEAILDDWIKLDHLP